MNKLDGLYELKKINLPSIDWNTYSHDTLLDNNYLWTIRTAIYKGLDLNLPRSFGKDSLASKEFADRLLDQIGDNGIVIYYPYLIAEKSGILQFNKNRIIIEAVEGDLSNLLSGSSVDVTYIWNDENKIVKGNENFLDINDQNLLLSNAVYLKRKYSEYMMLGEEMQLEFSFAYDSSVLGEKLVIENLFF